MAYEPKDNAGALFQNDKGGNDKRPDWRGDVMIAGTMYELAGWTKAGRKGDFISLSAKVKTERPERDADAFGLPPARKAPPPRDDLDDGSDVPF